MRQLRRDFQSECVNPSAIRLITSKLSSLLFLFPRWFFSLPFFALSALRDFVYLTSAVFSKRFRLIIQVWRLLQTPKTALHFTSFRGSSSLRGSWESPRIRECTGARGRRSWERTPFCRREEGKEWEKEKEKSRKRGSEKGRKKKKGETIEKKKNEEDKKKR